MLRYLAVICILLAALPVVAQSSEARSEVRIGVEEYKNARYESAIVHFQRAVDLDPNLINARIYLATACAQQYVPGVESPENTAIADRAVAEYKRVIEVDPRNVNSIKGVAYLFLMRKKFEDAKEYYRKASEVDPNDPETYYSIGVIDWTIAYSSRMQLLNEEAKKEESAPDQPPAPYDASAFIQRPECPSMREKNLGIVEDGIKMLSTALELRPDYDDAMAYMNLLFRERASLQCGDPSAYQKDADAADKWVDLTIATKKKRAEAAERRH